MAGIIAAIGVGVILQISGEFSKSILTFGPAVSGIATLDCPGLTSITVPLTPYEGRLIVPAVPQLLPFSNLQCLVTIISQDAQGQTEQSELVKFRIHQVKIWVRELIGRLHI